MSEKYEAEKSEHLSQIQSLQKELSCLSSSSLGREKENIRKDLEKTKAKLRDTESKLRNAIQEKTKLEVSFEFVLKVDFLVPSKAFLSFLTVSRC